MITQLELLKLLHYNPCTGVFAWIVAKQGNKIYDIAGTLNKEGYIAIIVNRKLYRAHRLAWLYMIGEWPGDQIDHVNGIRNDNRWINLREATISQNGANSNIRTDNTSGIKGVSWNREKEKWRVRINIDKKEMFLGYFDNIEDAKIAYKSAAIKHFGEYARF